MLPIVVAAIVLGAVFTRLFPGGASARTGPTARFTDVTANSGLRFVHDQGGPEAPTTLGGAVAVIDYDRDGHPDLFFVNGAPWPWDESLAKSVTSGGCALFHNDGTGHFTNVTNAAGLNVQLQGMAVAVGDYDNDGYPDIFVTCIGSNHLFHNRGNGTFEDVTEQAGVGGDDNTWSTGATWIDYDGDGRLDLVVVHYARWPREVGLDLAFNVAAVGRSYGAPTGFVSAFPSVYRNLGQGRFELVAGAAGLHDIDRQTAGPVGKGLAVVPLDANGDGRLDLLFTYQTSESALFINQGDGTFRRRDSGREIRREGAAAGLASASGPALDQAAATDERAAALQAAARWETRPSGDAWLSLRSKLGFALLDYDLDGHLEIFSGEGRVEPDTNRFEQGRPPPAGPQLWWNRGDSWVAAPVGGVDGGAWSRPIMARGIAVADLDGVIAQNNGPAVLLRNDQRSGRPWLRLSLVATRTQPDAGGARVEVHTPRRVFAQTVAPAMGFMGQSESVLTFGLGEDARVQKIVIVWPSGQRQEIRPEGINLALTVREP
jgi:hypothetical protein